MKNQRLVRGVIAGLFILTLILMAKGCFAADEWPVADQTQTTKVLERLIKADGPLSKLNLRLGDAMPDGSFSLLAGNPGKSAGLISARVINGAPTLGNLTVEPSEACNNPSDTKEKIIEAVKGFYDSTPGVWSTGNETTSADRVDTWVYRSQHSVTCLVFQASYGYWGAYAPAKAEADRHKPPYILLDVRVIAWPNVPPPAVLPGEKKIGAA